MKELMAALCMCVAACSAKGISNEQAAENADGQAQLAEAAEEAEPISLMLKGGKPEACAHPAVKARLYSELGELPAPEDVKRNWPEADVTQQDVSQAASEIGEPTFSDFQALEADAAVGALACGVKVKANKWPITLVYILRPSLENERDFLIAYPNGGISNLWASAVGGRAYELAAARKPPEPEWRPSWERDEDSNRVIGENETVSAM